LALRSGRGLDGEGAATSGSSAAGLKTTGVEAGAEATGSEAQSDAKASGAAMCFFGIYLLCGAYSSIANRKWPWFMPPQLDLVAAIFGGWESVSAAYVAGAVTGVLGLFFVGLAVWAWRAEA